MMVGRPTFGVDRQEPLRHDGEARLQVRGLSARGAPRPAGPARCRASRSTPARSWAWPASRGNGQTELAEVLSRHARGHQRLGHASMARSWPVPGPPTVMAAGVGRIPEDRHASLVLDLPVSLNLIMEHIDDFAPGGRLDRKAIDAHARRPDRALPDQGPTQRSRGHAVGRQHPEGAAGARAVARSQASSSSRSRPAGSTWVPASTCARSCWRGARDGAAILLMSEDLDELLALSDRVVVLYEGRIVGRHGGERGRPRAAGHADGRTTAGRR